MSFCFLVSSAAQELRLSQLGVLWTEAHLLVWGLLCPQPWYPCLVSAVSGRTGGSGAGTGKTPWNRRWRALFHLLLEEFP